MRDTQDAAGAQKLVAVGRVVKPHGIRGELCVEYQANSSELLAKGRTVWLRLPDKTNQPRSITGSRPHQGRWLVTLQGTADRDQAETLRGAEVLVPAGDLPALDENEVYLHEMVGYAVVLENGDPVGVLEGYMDAPGQDIWIIRSGAGKEILLPATEETVPDIDTKTRTITIAPPEGLLALYL